jgi:carboxymethylenebutenolidase
MRNFLLLFVAAFTTALLLGYTLKPSDAKILTAECYVTCFSNDVRDESKAEAATSAFAALHAMPLYYKLENAKGHMMSFKTADEAKGMAYRIKSKKKTKNYILVIQEWWGLNDYIKQEAEKLSDELGEVNVLALDMYDGRVATTRDSAMKYMSSVSNQRLENIIKGAIAYAGKDARIFTIGWCFGGMWSLQASILAGKQGTGCVMYYGRPETNLEKLKQLNADVIGFFGNKDQSPSPAMVDAFAENMKQAGKTLLVNRYEAGHGFANPSNPVFHKEATKDSHEKTIAFLKQRMK